MKSNNNSPRFTTFSELIARQLLILSLILLLDIKISAQENVDSTWIKLDSMSLEELLNLKVTIATKLNQLISESPSTVSVITADDIQKMGARELEDVLQRIPGFEIIRSYAGYYGIGVRGVKDSRTTSKILYMIDGVPINQIFFGESINWGSDLNLDNIERIEIIRGPGSALYGRNAFSAVINIITKKAKTGEKILVKADVGTFNTYSLSGLYTYKKNNFDAKFAIRKIITDVTDVKFDDGYGNISSWNLHRNNLALNTNLAYGKFRLTANYLDLSGNALISESYITNKTTNYSLSYDDSLNRKLTFHARFYGQNSMYLEDIEQLKSNLMKIIPPEMGGNGSLTYADIYPNGIYYKPITHDFLYGLESDIRIKLHKKNDLLIGLQADYHGVNDVTIKSNFNFANGQAFPGMTRDNMEKYEPGWFENEGHSYHNIAFIIQDIWNPIKKLGITLGGRLDIESEIGSVLSPRIGLVLEPFKNASCKLLYGRAYRAPAPSEQYVTLGYALGNKDLKPEIINTFEIAFSYRYEKTQNTLSIYRNLLTNMIYAEIISFVDPNNKYYNIGKNTSTGIEFETKFVIGHNFFAYLNYSYSVSENTQTIENKDSVYAHTDVAPHKVNFGINYPFLKYFNFNFNMYYRSTMEKYTIGDTGLKVLDQIGNYAVLNSTLLMQNLIKNFTFSFSVYNLTDTKYYSQDNQHFNQPPQPGRQFIFEIRYALK
jgi:outer membrane receptor for ferrienterochelin and colicins